MRLADFNGGTLLSYEVDAQVGGRLAQLGGPIIDATAKQLAGKFFKRFGEIVGAPFKTAAAQAPGAAQTAAARPAMAAAVVPAYTLPAQRGLPIA